jgi:beta-N-acetylhexosaminidase
MKQKRFLSLLIGLLLLTGCGGPSHSVSSQAVNSEPVAQDFTEEKIPLSDEEAYLAKMTLEEKVGQLFFLTYRQDQNGENMLSLNQAAEEEIKTIKPGGLILFRENISEIPQIRSFIQSAQKLSSCPLFVSVDQEGGTVQRITKTDTIPATVIPSMSRLGATNNSDLSRQVGQVIGKELSVFGFNMDFAPVCDVFSNPNNNVIGSRAFSGDPNVVSNLSVALANGLENSGIIPAAKHFPGHGDTDADSHFGYATSNKSLQELWKTELIPFQAQIDAGIPVIMTAHISLPAVTGDYTPASLSKQIITDLLRNEMGFDGIVITDALNMGAITKHYDSSEAAVLAIQAGVDMLLIPDSPMEAYEGVLSAVKNGTISEQRIDESVLRILKVKYEYDLFSPAPLSDVSILGSPEHQNIINQIP